MRQLLAAALLLGMAGTALELLLIGHYESVTQWAPTVAIPRGWGTSCSLAPHLDPSDGA